MSTKAHPDYAAAPTPDEWKLRLYVTDWSPRCVAAYRNLQRICQEAVGDTCRIEVVDLLERPEVARQDQIVAVPTLVKMSPEPKRVLVGDFTRLEQVLKGLDIAPAAHSRDDTAMIASRQGKSRAAARVVHPGSSGEGPRGTRLPRRTVRAHAQTIA